MKTKNLILLLLLILCVQTNAFSQSIYQVSYYQALYNGNLDGIISLEEIMRHGDTGLGGFSALDGEMILIDGKMYRIPASGKITQVSDLSIKATFADVCYFKPQKSITIHNDSNLYKTLDKFVSNANVFFAIRTKGTFDYIKTRSIAAQKKPYPSLTEIAKTQAVFTGENIQGTIIGFYTPAFANSLNLPGYHMHFIADDLSIGGHVLEVRPANIQCEIMVVEEVTLKLPAK